MKNKDFLEKSIRENIVDHKTVLNNIKAKAASAQQAGTSVSSSRVGFRRAALVFTLLALLVTGVLGAARLFDSSDGFIPPDLSDIHHNNSCSGENTEVSCPEDNSCSTASNGEESSFAESRDIHGGDESGTVITNDPLDEETALFFSGVTEKYNSYFKLTNNSLPYDHNYVPDSPDFNYRPVTSESLNSLQEMEDFVYDLLVPTLAAEDYARLTLVDNPAYTEINGVLFMDITGNGALLPVVHTETAYYIYTSEDRMAISVKISRITDGQEYYVRFSFKKIDGEWRLENKPF